MAASSAVKIGSKSEFAAAINSPFDLFMPLHAPVIRLSSNWHCPMPHVVTIAGRRAAYVHFPQPSLNRNFVHLPPYVPPTFRLKFAISSYQFTCTSPGRALV